MSKTSQRKQSSERRNKTSYAQGYAAARGRSNYAYNVKADMDYYYFIKGYKKGEAEYKLEQILMGTNNNVSD